MTDQTIPAPQNIGDIYAIEDYPFDGAPTEYGVAYMEAIWYGDRGRPEWRLQMDDGDIYKWSAARGRWDMLSGPQRLHRRNPLPSRGELHA